MRESDPLTKSAVAKLDSPELREIVHLEREVLRRLEGGCQLALGTAAEKTAQGFRLSVFLGHESGTPPSRIIINGTDVEEIVRNAVDYAKRLPLARTAGIANVWITREPERAGEFIGALKSRVYHVLPVPVFAAIEAGDPVRQKQVIEQLNSYNWVIFTSQVTVREFDRLMKLHGGTWSGGTKRAAVGRKTAQAAADLGWSIDFVGDVADAVSLAEQLADENRGRIGKVLFPCGQAAGNDLESGLASAVKEMERLVCYDMITHPTLSSAVRGIPDPDVIVFTSPQAARFLLAERPLGKNTIAVSIGPATSQVLQSLGCDIVYEAFDRSLEGTAEVTRGLFAL